MKLTAAERAEIQARHEKATPGPWVLIKEYSCHSVLGAPDPVIESYCQSGKGELAQEQGRVDLAFVAHARADIPRLLESDKEREAEIATLKARVAVLANPHTIQIWNNGGHWDTFCHDEPISLEEAERREEDLKAENPDAKFRVVPWLNASQHQEVVSPLKEALAAADKEELQSPQEPVWLLCERCSTAHKLGQSVCTSCGNGTMRELYGRPVAQEGRKEWRVQAEHYTGYAECFQWQPWTSVGTFSKREARAWVELRVKDSDWWRNVRIQSRVVSEGPWVEEKS